MTHTPINRFEAWVDSTMRALILAHNETPKGNGKEFFLRGYKHLAELFGEYKRCEIPQWLVETWTTMYARALIGAF